MDLLSFSFANETTAIGVASICISVRFIQRRMCVQCSYIESITTIRLCAYLNRLCVCDCVRSIHLCVTKQSTSCYTSMDMNMHTTIAKETNVQDHSIARIATTVFSLYFSKAFSLNSVLAEKRRTKSHTMTILKKYSAHFHLSVNYYSIWNIVRLSIVLCHSCAYFQKLSIFCETLS